MISDRRLITHHTSKACVLVNNAGMNTASVIDNSGSKQVRICMCDSEKYTCAKDAHHMHMISQYEGSVWDGNIMASGMCVCVNVHTYTCIRRVH